MNNQELQSPMATPTSEHQVSVALPGTEGIRSWSRHDSTADMVAVGQRLREGAQPTLTSLMIDRQTVIDLERIPG